MDTEALIAAVRAGDIEAAQALLPVDPIVKRAREICARHFGTPAAYIAGSMDDWPAMGAVTEALRATHSTVTAITDEQITLAARAVCYANWGLVDYLTAEGDKRANFTRSRDAIQAALVANPPVVPAMSA